MREKTDRFLVCISDGFLKLSKNTGEPASSPTTPKKGEIYEPVRHVVIMGTGAYVLKGFHPHDCWNEKNFRPVDYSTGEVIAEWIESVLLKQAELETIEQ